MCGRRDSAGGAVSPSMAALQAAIEGVFTQPAPEICCLFDGGHTRLGGEQSLFVLQGQATEETMDLLRFYSRAVAWTWQDYMVDGEGLPWPGHQILRPAELGLPGFSLVREDLLQGEFLPTSEREAWAWVGRAMAAANLDLALEPSTPQAAWQVIELWNHRRYVYRFGDRWVFVEWSTSA